MKKLTKVYRDKTNTIERYFSSCSCNSCQTWCGIDTAQKEVARYTPSSESTYWHD